MAFFNRLASPIGFLIGPILILAAAVTIASYYSDIFTDSSQSCRFIPGDSSWPSEAAWAELNGTVDGRLIATVPIAAPCHKSVFGQPNPLFDEDKCASLRDNWFFPETHLSNPTSPMSYSFSNNSCNPFSDSSAPCTLGSHPVYTINATSTLDFQTAIRFAKDHNIRLVIRNTGHDYLGKSTGAHSLSLWTHYMKSLELVDYKSEQYTGPAIKLGAGVEAMEAYRFASSHGLIVVGGNCPTVGLAGGFIQGGGLGQLISKYGLAADQVLGWEVVTSSGEVVTATATQNADLFWALRGGGAGTFGVVSSVTVKAFPETQTSMATMTIFNNGTNMDLVYSALSTFIRDTLPAMVDAGIYVVWIAAPFGFMIFPAVAPGIASDKLDGFMQPFIGRLGDIGLEYQYASSQHPTYMATYEALQPVSSWNVSDYNLGSRFIPRKVATQDTEALVEAVQYISSQTLMSAVSYNVAHSVSSPDDVAINPDLRTSLFSITLGAPVDYNDWAATKAGQDRITHDLLPALEKLTPGGAAYLNEADFQQPDFQRVIYGKPYERLLQIKRKYDPTGVFYAKTAVGSEDWAENGKGRLCRV
ncbi:FAD-binding domain-containing protein [Xylaria intraflava]|nr:FAD-binding domain-containing protein [Xylaria intraflava]